MGTEPAEKADGANFTQGIIVDKGQKGVWGAPLDPGMYPINPYTHKVELVPTTNIVLNWAKAKSEAHDLDKNLSSITVRSSDGFTFNLDVQQIIHIARQNASKVIARFGNMVNLVTQVLEPLIGNYFRNSAQRSDVIEFLRNRQERQGDAREHIKVALDLYNVQAVDTLIGDITPPAELMKTLTDRKVAEQQQERCAGGGCRHVATSRRARGLPDGRRIGEDPAAGRGGDVSHEGIRGRHGILRDDRRCRECARHAECPTLRTHTRDGHGAQPGVVGRWGQAGAVLASGLHRSHLVRRLGAHYGDARAGRQQLLHLALRHQPPADHDDELTAQIQERRVVCRHR